MPTAALRLPPPAGARNGLADPGGEALTLARSWSSVDTECPPCARAVAYSELGMPQNDFARSPSNLDARCAGLRTC